MTKSDFEQKWKKIFASKRDNEKIIILSESEQVEILNDALSIHTESVYYSTPRQNDSYEFSLKQSWRNEGRDDDGHGGTIKHFQD